MPRYENGSDYQGYSKNPLVSVVIPCWNAESFIGDAIESALIQTYPNMEVIVIDDGSTDGSLDVIRSFEGRVRWETGPNRGACAARNRGLQLAHGELIQFLDADDVLLPAKLSRMVPLAVSEGSNTMGISDWSIQSPESKRDINLNYAGEDPLVFMLGGKPIQTSSPLHRRVNLGRIGGFDETLPCCQERDLHLRLALLGLKLIYIQEALYVVRSRENSVSSDWLKVTMQRGIVFGKALKLAQMTKNLDGPRRDAFAQAFSRDARLLQRQFGRPDLAREHYGLAESTRRGASVNAFGNSWTRMVARLAGPIATEYMVAWIRPGAAATKRHNHARQPKVLPTKRAET